MSDGDFQREDRIYLPFIFEDEVIGPDEYLIWHQMREEETLMQYLEEYEPTNN
jgi:hypothetical protein